MKPAASSSEKVEQLVALGSFFAEREMHPEAAELFALALRLDPANAAARDALVAVRRAQREARGTAPSNLRDAVREEVRRQGIDGAHFIGLARLYADRGEPARAVECLEIAKTKASSNPGHHKVHGAVLSRRHDYEGAALELSRALLLDPFDREVAESLGRAGYESRDFPLAIGATVHAFLLLPDTGSEEAERLRTRILTLKRLLGWDKERLLTLFAQRRELLNTAFDRLEWHRERFLEEETATRGGVLFGAPPQRQRGGTIELAARLRALGVWSNLSDEQVFRLTTAVQEEAHEAGSMVFAHASQGRDLYVLEHGEITIQRPTSYGTFRLGTLPRGEIFGEVSFLAGTRRSGDAVAGRPSQVLCFDAGELQRLLAREPELAVQVYWSLWHGLARKLRHTNEQLRTFFADESLPENFLRLRRPQESDLEQIEVDRGDKIRIFREQGLSHADLVTLAAFSRERRYPDGSYVFQEGDRGDEMYIVVEGQALISTYIPGGGEEALAILERGDFFGEMSLIDGQPRSADARAHRGPLTILSLDQATVREVLTMDAAASLEFLQLLCRLLTERLLEIDEKVVGWRILSGGDRSPARAAG